MNFLSSILAAMSRMRLGHQLYGGFLIVLALTAGVAATAIYSLHRANAQAVVLSRKWLQGVGKLAATKAAVLEARDFEVKHSRTDDTSYHSEYMEKMTLAAKTIDTAMAAYANLVVGDTERALYDTFAKNWSTYQQAQQKVVDLGKEKKQQDAADISDGLASTAADDVITTLEQLTAYNFEGGTKAATDSNTVYSRTLNFMLGLIATVFLLGIALAYAINRSITEPIQRAVEVTQSVAAGDLTVSFEAHGHNETAQLLMALKEMQTSLIKVVGDVRHNSDNVATASAQISLGNQDLSQRTEKQASSLQETAASMEQLGAAVAQNANSAQQANQLATSASSVATQGGSVVSQVVETMKDINDSSKKIADIIGVIDGIAFQTNILALNAAVEAARAGEQGRGFAVVASEVRSLAGRSAEAAKEIKTLIAASVERVEKGSALVDQAGETMNEVVKSIKRVTDIVGEISSASHEQSAGVAKMGAAVSQMDEATQQNAALVEQSAAAAESLSNQAQQLVQSVAVFKLKTH
ncbi:MAG: methyl-accepting chemotaxis protein [Burkholderiales bacterium]